MTPYNAFLLWIVVISAFALIVLAGKLVAMSWGEWTERGRQRARRKTGA